MADVKHRVVKVAVRHARSVNNELAALGNPDTDRVGGYQPKVALAPAGAEQARKFGRVAFGEGGELADILGAPYRVVRFSSGPARRARDTAWEIQSESGPALQRLPLLINPTLHEQRKGHRWLGGDEKRLRSIVETPAYKARREGQGWDFRCGRLLVNRLGLYALHGAETPREAGARMVCWYEDIPPVSEEDLQSDDLLVDIAVGHGLATRYGTAMLLHSDPEDPYDIGVTVQEADQRYNMPNASAFVLASADSGLWVEQGRIIPDHS